MSRVYGQYYGATLLEHSKIPTARYFFIIKHSLILFGTLLSILNDTSLKIGKAEHRITK